MFKVLETLLLIVLVQASLILARRSADTKPDIVYNQAQNGTHNLRLKVDGVTVHLAAELFQDSPSSSNQKPLNDQNDDGELDYGVSWFKTQQIKTKSNQKNNHVKKSSVEANEPPSKFMRFLLRAMSQKRGVSNSNN